jgi:hypothetical protein
MSSRARDVFSDIFFRFTALDKPKTLQKDALSGYEQYNWPIAFNYLPEHEATEQDHRMANYSCPGCPL